MLYSYRCLDIRLCYVIYEFEILVSEIEKIFYVRVELHRREFSWSAGELFVGLV
jgi:hypothetical protein